MNTHTKCSRSKAQVDALLLAKCCCGPDIYRMRLRAPFIAEHVCPGQFVNVRVPGLQSVQFLRMPFAVSSCDVAQGSFEICYQVLGEGTRQLSELSVGQILDCVGPLGHGWSLPTKQNYKRVLICAGGLGAPALILLAAGAARRNICLDIAYAAQTKAKLVYMDEFKNYAQKTGGRLAISTDDGSYGVHGFINEISDEFISNTFYDYVAVCGPSVMEKSVCQRALLAGITCEVSMERLMACGVGACLGCVLETKAGFKRCCCDGPVFNAGEVLW